MCGNQYGNSYVTSEVFRHLGVCVPAHLPSASIVCDFHVSPQSAYAGKSPPMFTVVNTH